MSRKTTQQKQVNKYVKHIRFNTYFRKVLLIDVDYDIENISKATFLNSLRWADILHILSSLNDGLIVTFFGV